MSGCVGEPVVEFERMSSSKPQNGLDTHDGCSINDLPLTNLTLNDLPWKNQSDVGAVTRLDDSDLRSANFGKVKNCSTFLDNLINLFFLFIYFSDTVEECLDVLKSLDNKIVAHIQAGIESLQDDYCKRQRWISTGVPQIDGASAEPSNNYIIDGCDISASEIDFLANVASMTYTEYTTYANELTYSPIEENRETSSEFYQQQQYTTQHVEYEVSTFEYNNDQFEYVDNNNIHHSPFMHSISNETSEINNNEIWQGIPSMTNETAMTTEMEKNQIVQQCLQLQNNLTNVVEALSNNPASVHMLNYCTGLIPQSISTRRGDKLFTLKSPGEKGYMLVKLETYLCTDIIGLEKRQWWKKAQLRSQFLISSIVDPRHTTVKKLINASVKEVAGIKNVERTEKMIGPSNFWNQ